MAVPSALEDVKIMTSISTFVQKMNTINTQNKCFCCKIINIVLFDWSFRNDHEYQLWLRNDLYTNKHTQWYYFRLQNTRPGIKYQFTIMNLLKVREEAGKKDTFIELLFVACFLRCEKLLILIAWCWMQWALPRFLTWTRKWNNARTICTFANC